MAVLSRRESLQNIKPSDSTNPALWLDKYLAAQAQRSSSSVQQERTDLMNEVAALNTPIAYYAYYRQWLAQLTAMGVQQRLGHTTGRMVVGLGSESVLEANIRLHHTYGMPYIPGSALKGLAAAYARQRLVDDGWRLTGSAYATLFGDIGSRGIVTFFDALYAPGATDFPLALDVLTPHHRDYYDGKSVPPADYDDPNPVTFLSATGSYLVALGGPKDWVDSAYAILGFALMEYGIGAKTSSGYGRMSLEMSGDAPSP